MTNPFLDRLQRHRIVALAEINRRSVEGVAMRLLNLQMDSPSEPVHLWIDSSGGYNRPAMALHDLIKYALTVPVHALVIGQCASAATFTLIACSVRRAMPHAKFLIHSGTASDISLKMDDITMAKLDHLRDALKAEIDEVVEHYAQGLSMSTEQVKALIERGDRQFGSYLSAEEAKSIGLITEIVNDKLDVFSPSNR